MWSPQFGRDFSSLPCLWWQACSQGVSVDQAMPQSFSRSSRSVDQAMLMHRYVARCMFAVSVCGNMYVLCLLTRFITIVASLPDYPDHGLHALDSKLVAPSCAPDTSISSSVRLLKSGDRMILSPTCVSSSYSNIDCSLLKQHVCVFVWQLQGHGRGDDDGMGGRLSRRLTPFSSPLPPSFDDVKHMDHGNVSDSRPWQCLQLLISFLSFEIKDIW